MPSNIPSKSDENGAAEFIKYQKLCDLDYYSRFSREELETKHADILHLYEILKKDARVWIALSFALIPVSVLILRDFYLLFANPAYAFYTSKNMNIAEIIILLIHIGVLLLHAAFIAFSVSDSFISAFLAGRKRRSKSCLPSMKPSKGGSSLCISAFSSATKRWTYFYPHKGTNMYSFVNLSKGHICPCLFSSIDAAIADLDDPGRNVA